TWSVSSWEDPVRLVIVVVLALLLALVGGAIGGLLHLIIHVFLKAVPNNFYGIVNGHKPHDESDDPELLTDWLNRKLDYIAGLEKGQGPLTFGHLCGRTIKGPEGAVYESITLQMISTNVSQGLPYRLPFDKKIFLFHEVAMRDLFPKNVVDHMVRTSYKSKRIGPGILPDGYHYLPEADDFPVVVGVRMSLAIPIFFSAIPFYTIKETSFAHAAAGNRLSAKDDLQVNWFSDGGTTSNFPIHSFDRWLPTRPTFGINLTAMPPKAIHRGSSLLDKSYLSAVYEADSEENLPGAGPGDGGEALLDGQVGSQVPAVELPEANQIQGPEWRPIANPLAFLLKVVDTARENHDTLLSMLPGYRERIVEIRFTDGEGGMNLTMDDTAISSISLKGEMAGLELRDEFNFDHHRWTRFLVLMSQLEVQLEKLKTSYEKGHYADLLARVDSSFPYTGGHSQAWRAEANKRACMLIAVVDEWKRLQATEQQEAAMLGTAPPPASPHYTAAASGSVGSPQSPDQPQQKSICESLLPEPDLDFFNARPPARDYTPKPKSVLRVTPDM
ncbi:MAG: patatin-like phospholipase family protein, partial [Chloroflexota bacterium]|nr:patatin-like phospholipase family protein [Chloroflexota bacterium]